MGRRKYVRTQTGRIRSRAISNLNFRREILISTVSGGRNVILREQNYVILHRRKCRDIKRNILTSVLVHNHPSSTLLWTL